MLNGELREGPALALWQDLVHEGEQRAGLALGESARDGYAALYAELARAFGRMVRVLAALPGNGAASSPAAVATGTAEMAGLVGSVRRH